MNEILSSRGQGYHCHGDFQLILSPADMVSFIIIDQIILIFIYYYQINTDSHMASRGDAVPVSQEMSQVQLGAEIQAVIQEKGVEVQSLFDVNSNKAIKSANVVSDQDSTSTTETKVIFNCIFTISAS